jgi:HSP20 family protein
MSRWPRQEVFLEEVKMANTKNNQASKKQQQQSNKNKQHSSQSLQTNELARSQSDIARLEVGTATPFTFMRRFGEEMDRLFGDFGFGALGNATWAPQVEVFERNNQLVVRADLPGMTKDNVDVDVTDDALVIRGERNSEREEEDEGYYRSERSYGSFYRRIPLPESVNAEQAKADFRNGVLEITMPASQGAEQKRRQLEIRGESEAEAQPRAKVKAAGQR